MLVCLSRLVTSLEEGGEELASSGYIDRVTAGQQRRARGSTCGALPRFPGGVVAAPLKRLVLCLNLFYM